MCAWRFWNTVSGYEVLGRGSFVVFGRSTWSGELVIVAGAVDNGPLLLAWFGVVVALWIGVEIT